MNATAKKSQMNSNRNELYIGFEMYAQSIESLLVHLIMVSRNGNQALGTTAHTWIGGSSGLGPEPSLQI